MSEENVELAHRAFDAFNRRDLDAFLALMDPEVELRARFMELEGEAYFRGGDSGVPIGQELWQASKVRGGKVTWWRNFESEAEALEAAGLEE